MTETRNPWNFIIPTLKVSLTKVQGFFDLRECYFQTSFHIRVNKMIWWQIIHEETIWKCSITTTRVKQLVMMNNNSAALVVTRNSWTETLWKCSITTHNSAVALFALVASTHKHSATQACVNLTHNPLLHQFHSPLLLFSISFGLGHKHWLTCIKPDF